MTNLLLPVILMYVERQAIVKTALQELCPEIIEYKLTNDHDKYMDFLSTPHPNRRSSGFWGDQKQWDYFVHGFGCWLTHTITGEPIDWDAPDVNVFDYYKFERYAIWFNNLTGYFLDSNGKFHIRTEFDLLVATGFVNNIKYALYKPNANKTFSEE